MAIDPETTNKIKKIQEVSYQDYFGIILRGKWIIIGMIVAGFLTAFIYTKIIDPVYKATASILINTRLQQAAIILNGQTRWEGEKNFTQNELEILKSKALAAEVAAQLLDRMFVDDQKSIPLLIIQASKDDPQNRKFAPVDQIVGRLEKAIDFGEVPETDVIQINIKSPSGQEAALIANMVAKAYYDRNIRTSRAKSQAFREFLEAQLIDKRRELSDAEDSLQEFMDKYGIVLLDEQSRRMNDQLASLESQRDETDVNIQSLTKTLATYQEEIPEQQKAVSKAIGEANDPYIRILQEQLAQLEVNRDVAIAQNPGIADKNAYNKQLTDIDNQIASLRSQLQKRTDEFMGSLLPGAQTGTETAGYLRQVIQRSIEAKMDLQTLQAKKNALDNVISSHEAKFGLLPGKNTRFARLQRVKMSCERLYTTIQEKYNEAVMTEQSQFGYVEIVDNARPPSSPSSPKVFLLVALGTVLGLSIGIIVVFIKERIDIRIQTPEDLKREGMTIRGTIIEMKSGFEASKENPLLGMAQSFSPIAEAFKHLRTNLSFSSNGQVLKTLLVTSSKPGEGKSTILANLAIAFSQLGKRVVAVDGDMRKPTLYTFFGCHPEPGLSDFLLGDMQLDQIIQQTKVDNLHFIGSGVKSSKTSELISSPLMKRFLEIVQQHYDIVLIDSPPVLAGTEPTILSTLTDQVIMVVSAGDTRYSELHRAIEEISEPQGKVPGVVLNKFNIYRAYGIPYGRSDYGYYPYASKS